VRTDLPEIRTEEIIHAILALWGMPMTTWWM
jgi:hypothetical protein